MSCSLKPLVGDRHSHPLKPRTCPSLDRDPSLFAAGTETIPAQAAPTQPRMREMRWTEIPLARFQFHIPSEVRLDRAAAYSRSSLRAYLLIREQSTAFGFCC